MLQCVWLHTLLVQTLVCEALHTVIVGMSASNKPKCARDRYDLMRISHTIRVELLVENHT